MTTAARYCVIGAGAAGLSALAELVGAGYDVDCYEKADRVGGHWNHDYDALHLITSRDMTHFDGFPMPAEYPHFPRRDLVRDYIHSYARERGLSERIQFSTAVTAVVPSAPAAGADPDAAPGSAGWDVTLSDGRVLHYDGVLVANGHLWDQKVPAISAGFTGTQVHSGSYRNTGDVEGTRVLVVGAGNSGCDLAVDAAQHRLDVEIVIREGVHFQPKSYFGVPRQEVPFLAQFSPDEQDLIARMLAKVSIGEAKNYPGLPDPKGRTLAEGRAVVNDLLLYWIQHGRITVRPGIEAIDGRVVTFADGTSGEYDTILWATGFHASLPFLEESLLERRGGVPLRYAGGIVPAGLEKLYFIGLIAPRGPQIPVYGMQARLVLRMLALHEGAAALGAASESGSGSAALASAFAAVQEPEDGIDVVRVGWLADMADTERLLTLLEHRHVSRPADAQGQAQASGVAIA